MYWRVETSIRCEVFWWAFSLGHAGELCIFVLRGENRAYPRNNMGVENKKTFS
jgi:hypothetical protein